jgi:hypothetical protein
MRDYIIYIYINILINYIIKVLKIWGPSRSKAENENLDSTSKSTFLIKWEWECSDDAEDDAVQ